MENNLIPLSPGSSFEDIFKRHQLIAITKWPLCSQSSDLEKLNNELDELKLAIVHETSDEQLLEYIDCLLCLISSLIRGGFSIEQLRQRMAVKVNINYAREWKYNGNGTYSHIKKECNHLWGAYTEPGRGMSGDARAKCTLCGVFADDVIKNPANMPTITKYPNGDTLP